MGHKSEIVKSIKASIISAMKSKDKVRVDLLRTVIGECDRTGKDLTDAGVIKIMKKMQNNLEQVNTAESYTEYNIIQEFVPVMLKEEEVDEIIKSIFDGNPDKVEQYRDGNSGVIGFFMSEAIKKCAGRGDNAYINRRFREFLKK